MIFVNVLNLFIFKIYIDLIIIFFFFFRLVFDKENDCSNLFDLILLSVDNRLGVVDLFFL